MRLSETLINVVQLLKAVPFRLVLGTFLVFAGQEAHSQNLVTEYLKKVAADAAAGDEYGAAVAVEGDWAVIGAPVDQDITQANDLGAAYILYRHQGGPHQWGEFKKLSTLLPGEGNRFFGAAVAISGDTVAVGAYQPDRRNAGAVYLFERNRGGENRWGESKRIVPADGASGDQFGYSVDLDGDVLVVGANKADASAAVGNSGVAYVYERDAGGPDNWGKVRKLEPDLPFADDFFGESVAIHGATIAVGVVGDDDFAVNGGSVCLFDRNVGGLGQWGFLKKISPTFLFASDQFGNAVSLHGTTLVAGARLADTTDINTGAAYVFERDAGGTNQWGQVAELSAGALGGDQFGAGVSVFEDEIAVGAPNADVAAEGAGTLYRFKRDQGGGNQWRLITYLGASDAAAGDRLGASVSLHGDMILGGAPSNDDAGDKSGSAYVYWFPPTLPTLSIVTAGTDVVISWEPPTPDFILQRSGSLDAGSWTNAPSGNMNPVTVPMSEAAGFFRLILP